jgi:hypothetical protein
MTGGAHHKDGRHLRHTLDRLGELHRRAGGTLPGAQGAEVRAVLAARLEGVKSLDDFQRRDLKLELDDFVTAEARRPLEALPSFIEVSGERCPLDYEIDNGRAVVRIRMKEHVARRLASHEVPELDRPVEFTVVRGKHAAIRADSVQALRRALSGGGTDRRKSGSTRRRRRRP